MDPKWTQATSRRNGNAPNLYMQGHEFEYYAGRFKHNFCFSFYFLLYGWNLIPTYNCTYIFNFCLQPNIQNNSSCITIFKTHPFNCFKNLHLYFCPVSTCTQIYMYMSVSLFIFQKTELKCSLASLIWSETFGLTYGLTMWLLWPFFCLHFHNPDCTQNIDTFPFQKHVYIFVWIGHFMVRYIILPNHTSL